MADALRPETTTAGTTYATAAERDRLRAGARRRLRLALVAAAPVFAIAIGLGLLVWLLGPPVLYFAAVGVAVLLTAAGVAGAVLLGVALWR